MLPCRPWCGYAGPRVALESLPELAGREKQRRHRPSQFRSLPVPISHSDAVPDPMQVASPAVSSRRCANGKKEKKRKRSQRANVGISSEKKSKAASDRNLPTGVRKLKHGKFQSAIGWGGKRRYIGTFDNPEEASAAYISVKKDLNDAKVSALGADEVVAIFDSAKKTARESVGGS